MTKDDFTEKKILILARDNPIVRNFLAYWETGELTYQETLIGMILSLVGLNNALLDLLREKKETEVPLYILHTEPANKEIIEKIQKLIQDDKVVFEPGYTIDPQGRVEIKHISINPKHCPEEK